jgi:hypothetical protein
LSKLRDYADDAYYEEEEEEEPEPCSPNLTVVSDASAQGLTQLLDVATTMDAPFSEVLTFEVSGCDTWTTNEVDRTAFVIAVFEQTFPWSWGDISSRVDIGTPTVGGQALAAELDLALFVIDQEIDDEDWDPNASAANAAAYAAGPGWVEDLTEDAASNPDDYDEIEIYVDLLECSEEAVIRVHRASGSVVVAHRFWRC